MQTVTTPELEAAFIDAIRLIVPTYEPLRACGWAHLEKVERRGGRPQLLGLATRIYCLAFSGAKAAYQWHGGLGTDYACRLAVATSYSGVHAQQLQHMLIADAVDLRGAFAKLRDPTLPGFVNAEPDGIQNEDVDDLGNVYVEHVFTLHWHQATDGI